MRQVTCIVETLKGSSGKFNFDPQRSCFKLSKVLPAGLVFPFDFGYIPGTRGQDGDPLDAVIISEIPLFTGCALDCRIIGAIKALQEERDQHRMRNDRYIAIPEVSVLYDQIRKASQLPVQIREELQNFFINYNQQAGKRFKPLDWLGPERAWSEIEKATDDAEPTKLIQLFVPMHDGNGKYFPEKYFAAIRQRLTEKFGGITAYEQSPVTGLWQDHGHRTEKDKMIVYEVMVSRIDKPFWEKYKKALQKQFRQDELVIRQSEVGLL